jgi:DNA replication and repair protein RecF
VKVTLLTVQGFRNLQPLRFEPSPGINGFFGANGQGKTNILESLYATLKGKSFRPYAGRADWLPALGPKECQVNVEVEDDRGYSSHARMTYSQSGRGQWDFLFNGKKVSPARIQERIPVVVFSPDDHALVRLEPEVRRSFLDDMLCDVGPGYAETLTRFETALRSRNRILKQLRDEGSSTGSPELGAWSEAVCQSALDIWQARWELWPNFARHFDAIVHNLDWDETFAPTLRFEPDLSEAPTLEKCRQHILRDVRTDIALGWTRRGPHRDDFRVLLKDVEARAGASQGQSRLIALALKWAHAEWVREGRGELPIFLVDDFSSEFDASRRARLLQFLKDVRGQVFLTGTEASLVDSEAFWDYNLQFVARGVTGPSTHMKEAGC